MVTTGVTGSCCALEMAIHVYTVSMGIVYLHNSNRDPIESAIGITSAKEF